MLLRYQSGKGNEEITNDLSDNTFLGRKSGLNNIASFNTFIGSNTGVNNKKGTKNTFIGSNSGAK